MLGSTRRLRQAVLLFGVLLLAGCKAPVSPAAECRERASHRYDPGPIAIAPHVPLVVRTLRCDGPFGERASACTDDAPAEFRFTVTTNAGPPRCSAWDMRADCWWGNEPGSSHGDSPGEIDMAGTYTLASAPLGGATEIVAHVGVAHASAVLRVRLVLVENAAHLGTQVIDALDGRAGLQTSLEAPPDGAVWRTDQGDGTVTQTPVLKVGGQLTAVRVHIENVSGSLEYDGYFASSPIALSAATWRAITGSTQQDDALVVRVQTLSNGALAVSPEQHWHVDHGIFYHSPESLAEDEAKSARDKQAREAFERTWVDTHDYIPRDEAIARAVSFLEEQGFTNAPAAGPLVRDIVDFAPDAELRTLRHGSIDPAAVGTVKKAGWWWVAFREVHGDPCHVRVVAVAADGKRRRMLHQVLSLSSFE